MLSNTKEELRETVAGIYGLVAGNLEEDEFERTMKELSRGFKDKQLEFQHGVLLALGHSFGRRILLIRQENKGINFKVKRLFLFYTLCMHASVKYEF